MSEKLEQKIIERIKSGHLSPRPQWHFLMKEGLIWAVGGLALLVGAAAVSVMIYLGSNNDWPAYSQAGRSFGAWLLLSLPYFWLIFLGLFLWLLSYNLKHTKRGYRYPISLIVSAAVIASIILGFIFSAVGLGEKIDNILGRQAPLYDRVFNPHIDFWSQPADGRLAGLVVSLSDQEHFVLVDRERSQWMVTHDAQVADLIIAGQPVRVVGKISGELEFTAKDIMPMKPGREFFKRFQPGDMPPILPGPGASCDCVSVWPEILKQYPEVKATLERNLLADKDHWRSIVNERRDFLPALQSLGLSDYFWQELLAE